MVLGSGQVDSQALPHVEAAGHSWLGLGSLQLASGSDYPGAGASFLVGGTVKNHSYVHL